MTLSSDTVHLHHHPHLSQHDAGLRLPLGLQLQRGRLLRHAGPALRQLLRPVVHFQEEKPQGHSRLPQRSKRWRKRGSRTQKAEIVVIRH